MQKLAQCSHVGCVTVCAAVVGIYRTIDYLRNDKKAGNEAQAREQVYFLIVCLISHIPVELRITTR